MIVSLGPIFLSALLLGHTSYGASSEASNALLDEDLTCADIKDGKFYHEFQVRCNRLTGAGSQIKSDGVASSFTNCMDICSANSQCKGVNYQRSSKSCVLWTSYSISGNAISGYDSAYRTEIVLMTTVTATQTITKQETVTARETVTEKETVTDKETVTEKETVTPEDCCHTQFF